MAMQLRISSTHAVVNGFEYPIPTRWIDPSQSTGGIEFLMITTKDCDPYWNEDTDVPYIFHNFSAMKTFVTKNDVGEGRVFVMDRIFHKRQWSMLPVAELGWADAMRQKGRGISIFGFNTITEEKEQTNVYEIVNGNSTGLFSYQLQY
jgi:hypothetical protein